MNELNCCRLCKYLSSVLFYFSLICCENTKHHIHHSPHSTRSLYHSARITVISQLSLILGPYDTTTTNMDPNPEQKKPSCSTVHRTITTFLDWTDPQPIQHHVGPTTLNRHPKLPNHIAVTQTRPTNLMNPREVLHDFNYVIHGRLSPSVRRLDLQRRQRTRIVYFTLFTAYLAIK